jgi:hypothetical protein
MMFLDVQSAKSKQGSVMAICLCPLLVFSNCVKAGQHSPEVDLERRELRVWVDVDTSEGRGSKSTGTASTLGGEAIERLASEGLDSGIWEFESLAEAGVIKAFRKLDVTGRLFVQYSWDASSRNIVLDALRCFGSWLPGAVEKRSLILWATGYYVLHDGGDGKIVVAFPDGRTKEFYNRDCDTVTLCLGAKIVDMNLDSMWLLSRSLRIESTGGGAVRLAGKHLPHIMVDGKVLLRIGPEADVLDGLHLSNDSTLEIVVGHSVVIRDSYLAASAIRVCPLLCGCRKYVCMFVKNTDMRNTRLFTSGRVVTWLGVDTKVEGSVWCGCFRFCRCAIELLPRWCKGIVTNRKALRLSTR